MTGDDAVDLLAQQRQLARAAGEGRRDGAGDRPRAAAVRAGRVDLGERAAAEQAGRRRISGIDGCRSAEPRNEPRSPPTRRTIRTRRYRNPGSPRGTIIVRTGGVSTPHCVGDQPDRGATDRCTGSSTWPNCDSVQEGVHGRRPHPVGRGGAMARWRPPEAGAASRRGCLHRISIRGRVLRSC